MLPLLTVSGSPLVASRQAAGAVTDAIPAAAGSARPSDAGRGSTSGGGLSISTLNPLQINSVSDRGLAQRQEQMIQQQDAIIADIERGVDRLHNRALEIGQETRIQVRNSFYKKLPSLVLLLFYAFDPPTHYPISIHSSHTKNFNISLPLSLTLSPLKPTTQHTNTPTNQQTTDQDSKQPGRPR